MSEILHQLHIQSPRPDVHRALTTIDGLATWWTRTTEGTSAIGEHIDFRFGSHVTRVRVDTLTDDRVSWTITDSNPDWEGTTLHFDLVEEEGQTLLQFAHRDWREANSFFGHCSMKWAIFLLSLKSQLERGEGQPFPDDVAI